MKYKMIALDMDGTVLNSEKQIDPKTKYAIEQALAAGKEVVFCSGRSYTEMEEFLGMFPDMHYLCGESGAMVYDLKQNKPVSLLSFPVETVEQLRDSIREKDLMVQIFHEGRTYLEREKLEQMAHYQMEIYYESFRRNCILVDDIFDFILKTGGSVEKINLYHTTSQERAATEAELRDKQLPAMMVHSEITSLECSPVGVDKAAGLRCLCEILGISMDEVIMVGDADNDRAALEAVGLPLAMGNAKQEIKAICKAVVADNDHNGCAEAIEVYLSGKAVNQKV